MPIPLGVQPKSNKVEDVGKLLEKHYDSKWRELEVLSFPKDALDSTVYKCSEDKYEDIPIMNIDITYVKLQISGLRNFLELFLMSSFLMTKYYHIIV